MMLTASPPRPGVIAALFLAAGTIHGYALAEAVIGAERTPLLAYLAGLTVIQCAIAIAAWRIALWISARRPELPLQALAGVVVSVAGFVFIGLAAL
jgi:urease accessory protein